MDKKQDIAYYPAGTMPPPDAAGPHPIDRSAALEVEMETPLEALRRRAELRR
jgi:hypothetical protein